MYYLLKKCDTNELKLCIFITKELACHNVDLHQAQTANYVPGYYLLLQRSITRGWILLLRP